jgi:two-component system heavy metal sensor histidine kinase CusS
VIRECWSVFEDVASERQLDVEWTLGESLTALLDVESARRVFSNLFDNAVTCTPVGGRICLSVAQEESRIIITIGNDGCTLPGSDASRVFDRFWRGDASRTGGGLHCGLGLSLCKQLMELQRGTISADIRDGWFVVTLVLPAAPAPCVTADMA